jgi:hypothetical protein
MNWNEFMERHDRWSGATLRSRIYALKDIGTNEEVIAMVLEMPEERYKAQLIRKAIKLGNVFSDEDIEKLRGALAASTYNEIFVDFADDAKSASSANKNDEDDDLCDDCEVLDYEPSRHRVRIFTKRNKVMDALAKLFGLPVPPEKRNVICGCPYNCDECPKKKTKSAE